MNFRSRPENTITINSRKFDGSVQRSWECEFVERSGDLLTFYGEFQLDVEHPDLGFIRRGTGSYEYYWLHRWYNIFRFHEPDNRLRNFYCNINIPPTFGHGILDYVDLDIDVLVNADLSYKVLDVDDFERNSLLFGYTKEIEKQVDKSLHEVIGLIEGRAFPFDYVG